MKLAPKTMCALIDLLAPQQHAMFLVRSPSGAECVIGPLTSGKEAKETAKVLGGEFVAWPDE